MWPQRARPLVETECYKRKLQKGLDTVARVGHTVSIESGPTDSRQQPGESDVDSHILRSMHETEICSSNKWQQDRTYLFRIRNWTYREDSYILSNIQSQEGSLMIAAPSPNGSVIGTFFFVVNMYFLLHVFWN